MSLLPYSSARRMFIRRQSTDKKIAPTTVSIEHIVPQSRLKRCGYPWAVGDMHNFLIYPVRLNQARGTSRMVDEGRLLANSSKIRALDEHGNQLPPPWTSCSLRRAAAWVGDGVFVPPRRLRGRIARAIAYMRSEYPGLQEEECELDPQLLLSWHLEFPVCPEERAQERWIASVQGSSNNYVIRPALMFKRPTT